MWIFSCFATLGTRVGTLPPTPLAIQQRWLMTSRRGWWAPLKSLKMFSPCELRYCVVFALLCFSVCVCVFSNCARHWCDADVFVKNLKVHENRRQLFSASGSKDSANPFVRQRPLATRSAASSSNAPAPPWASGSSSSQLLAK